VRVLDLCAGIGGWSRPARERGHDVTTLDVDPRFGTDVVADVITWEPPPGLAGSVDLLMASPPCDAFSVLNIGKNWTKPPGNEPKTPAAEQALRIVEGVLRVIEVVQPRWYVIENPRAKLRRVVEDRWPDLSATRQTVTYCQYDQPMMKPTDLWGRFPPSLVLRPPCRSGDPCHIKAPRGSTSATQGFGAWKDPDRSGALLSDALAREFYGTSDAFMLAALRAAIPRSLALAFVEAAEADLAALGVAPPAQPVEFVDGPGQLRLFAG
jgi:hypothetical protein